MTTIGIKKLRKQFVKAYPTRAAEAEAIVLATPRGGLMKESIKGGVLAQAGGLVAMKLLNRHQDRKAVAQARHSPSADDAMQLPRRFAMVLSADGLALMALDTTLTPVEVIAEFPRGSYWITDQQRGTYAVKCTLVTPKGRHLPIEAPCRTVGRPNVPALEAVSAAGAGTPAPQPAA